MLMRDHIDNNGIQAETIKITKVKVLDRDLQIPNLAFRATNAPPNLSQILQKLEHCTGKIAEALHNHLTQSKLQIKGFDIDPNFCEAVTVVVSSFTGQLGNTVADHADEIFKLNFGDALPTYVRVSFSNEDLEGKYYVC